MLQLFLELMYLCMSGVINKFQSAFVWSCNDKLSARAISVTFLKCFIVFRKTYHCQVKNVFFQRF